MSAFDFSSLPASFGNTTELPIARDGGRPVVKGIVQGPGWTTGTIAVAAVFPLSPRELDALPEGQRERGAIQIFTAASEPIRVVGFGETDEDGYRGDVVAWQGALWQAVQLDDYGPAGGFRRVVCVRMDRPAAMDVLATLIVQDGDSARAGTAAGTAITAGQGAAV